LIRDCPADDTDRASSGNDAALAHSELICHALCGIPDVSLFFPEILGPRPEIGPFDCSQHKTLLGIVEKLSENDALPDANSGTASEVDKYLQRFGID
jgi:hypothetical protein